MATGSRRGLAGIGTWIMDHVRLIDAWPGEQTLANVHGEEFSGGGLAHNLVVDVARFDLGIPLEGIGFVGDDDDGRRILDLCRSLGVDSDRPATTTSSRSRTQARNSPAVNSSVPSSFLCGIGFSALAPVRA